MARTANKGKKEAEKRAGRIAAAKRQKRKSRLMWGGIAVVGIIAIVGLISLIPDPADSPDAATATGAAAVGSPAPSVDMVAFNGDQVTLSQFEGTPVVLNFWATWCPFCVAEMPDFEKVNQASDGRVQFIGVDLQDDPGAAADLVEETGVTYLLTRDPQGVVYNAFGGVAMPTTVFIGADGIVDEIVAGAMTADQLSNKIDQHFPQGA
ncbi:MAG: TlpA disulfide reductase family protein [Actinomycetota bacterium]